MKRVLIVDDSIAVARQLQKILTDSGSFEVIGHAHNGVEAIKMQQELKPDLVCMDMNMPGMDGLTALRSLMALDPSIKVVMVTSLGGVSDKFTEALKLGARNVITKPFEAANVVQALSAL
ncbi:MAG TPA: response regulator [Geobacterales bacterium]|jgi:two-component system chemotaxis response regulator CheY|nr:response regulator [Geobacterales bacterium]